MNISGVQAEPCDEMTRYDCAMRDLHAAIFSRAATSEITKHQRLVVEIRNEIAAKLKNNA